MHGTVSGNAANRREMLVRNDSGGILDASAAEEGRPGGERLGNSGFRAEDAGRLYEGGGSFSRVHGGSAGRRYKSHTFISLVERFL